MLGWFWIFSIFVFNLSLLTTVTYWSSKNAQTLTLWGWHFKNLWIFWLVLVAVATPLYALVNYLFLYAYWYGYNKLFPSRMWMVTEIQWLASLVITFLITWLYLGELPSRNAVLALLFLGGALAAILWK